MTPLSASGAAMSHRRFRRADKHVVREEQAPAPRRPSRPSPAGKRSRQMPGDIDPDVESGPPRAEEELREQPMHDDRSPELEKMAAEAAAGWQAAYAELKRQDERMCQEYKEDIDTVLIFAGLFSAVVSSLLSQSYPLLQQDNTQVSADALLAISQQLAALLSNATSGQEASSPLPSADFVPDSYAIRVNVLWLLSLVFSLAAALFGIVIKGWMQEYMAWVEWAPLQDAVGLRQYRFENWNWWQVPEIKASLPILLQVSLFLFLIGLADMLTHTNSAVARIVVFAVWVVVSLAGLTVFLAVFSWTCPYRSRVVWLLSMARSALTTHIVLLNLLICRRFHLWVSLLGRLAGPSVLWAHISWNDMDRRRTSLAFRRGISHIFRTSRDDGLLLQLRYTLYDVGRSGQVNIEHCVSCLKEITGNSDETERCPDLVLWNYADVLRRIVRLNRHSIFLSVRSTDLVTSLVRDALWELMASDWSASPCYKDLVGLFHRFNRSIPARHRDTYLTAFGASPSNTPQLTWITSTRRDVLLHEAIVYSDSLMDSGPQEPDENRTYPALGIPAEGWPHSEILELLAMATRCSRKSSGFGPVCRAVVTAFVRTRSASHDPTIQAALMSFVWYGPCPSAFKALDYADDSRLSLARCLLEVLAEAHNLRDAEIRMAVTSLHHLNRGAASELHAPWRFRYLILLDALLPHMITDDYETMQKYITQDLLDLPVTNEARLPVQAGSERNDVLELLRCIKSIYRTAGSSQDSFLIIQASSFAMRAAAVRLSSDAQDIVLRAALQSLLHSLEDAMACNDGLSEQLNNAGVLRDLHAAGLLAFDIWPGKDGAKLDLGSPAPTSTNPPAEADPRGEQEQMGGFPSSRQLPRSSERPTQVIHCG